MRDVTEPLLRDGPYAFARATPAEAEEINCLLAENPMEGRIRCAGIVEFGGLDAPPSEAPFRLLEKKFRRAFPHVTWERTERWMGHRPATTDSLPVIGELETAKGVYAGFGHQHVGLTGGPKTGYLLAQLIGGKKPNMDMAPYSPMRFR